MYIVRSWDSVTPFLFSISYLSLSLFIYLVAWSSGLTLVFGRRAFAVLRSACSWRGTTYVGKPSATGQPTRPTQPFILSRSINEYWVVSSNRVSAVSVEVVPSGPWRMLTGWRPGVVDWGGGVLASCYLGSNCPLARAADGHICAAAPLSLANQLPLPRL